MTNRLHVFLQKLNAQEIPQTLKKLQDLRRVDLMSPSLYQA